MGIEQLLIETEKKGSEKKGIEKGKSDVVANLIQQLGLDDQAAAEVAEVSIDFVRKVRKDLAKKKK
ncbi:hypothetical protein [Parapedobacter tibetensis]|uniref:hypothetical protein n=1 Tax=Parapedobacter tibetensis TaxID=2972951 RepID=UPI00214DD206|nr:hypothetical protein [Parapedobacter tibetensis]